MSQARDDIYWGEQPEPEWDNDQMRYYFLGYRISSGKPTKRYLKDHEIDENGFPLPNLNPASSAGHELATPRIAPGDGGYGTEVGLAGGQLDTHLANSQEAAGQYPLLSEADASAAQFSQEYTHQAEIGTSVPDHSQGAQVQTPITSVGYSAGGPTTSEPGLEATAPLHHETGAPGGTSYDQQTQSGYSVVTRGKDVATPFPRAPGGHSVASHQHHSRSSGGQRHRSSRDKHSHQTVPRESRNTALYDPASSQYAHYQNSEQPIEQYQPGDTQNSGEPMLYNTGSAQAPSQYAHYQTSDQTIQQYHQPADDQNSGEPGSYNTHSGQNPGWSSGTSRELKHAAYGGLPSDGVSPRAGFADPTTIQRTLNPERPEHIASDRRGGTKGGLDPNLLDPNFRIWSSKYFRPGRIFKVLWSEPKGTAWRAVPFMSQISRIHTYQMADARRAFWVGFRRFIVLRNNQGHCNCVPIYSYQGQACAKPGVKPAHHGIIYENSPNNQPLLQPGEPELGFSPIRATTTSGDPLTEASRVNYAKVVTVEHNVKVLFVGDIVPEDRPIVESAVRESLGWGPGS